MQLPAYWILTLSIILICCSCISQTVPVSGNASAAFYEKVRSSLSYYDNLILVDPSNATAWRIRGNYYNDAFNQYDIDLESYDRALDPEPGYGYAWFSKGVTPQNMKRFNESSICF